MSIKIKNNNMGMYSPNSVNICNFNNGSNDDHINIRKDDDELEIDIKTYATSDSDPKTILINNHFYDCLKWMNEAKTISRLNNAYNMAKHYYEMSLKKPITTCELEELYNINKTRIKNSFLNKIINLFS